MSSSTPDCVGGVYDFVRGPIGIPGLGMHGVVGEQVCVVCQLNSDRHERGTDLIEVACDQYSRVRVETSQSAIGAYSSSSFAIVAPVSGVRPSAASFNRATNRAMGSNARVR